MGRYAHPPNTPRVNQVSREGGGEQIEQGDRTPRIYEGFEAGLAENGEPRRMRAFSPTCTGEVGPTKECCT